MGLLRIDKLNFEWLAECHKVLESGRNIPVLQMSKDGRYLHILTRDKQTLIHQFVDDNPPRDEVFRVLRHWLRWDHSDGVKCEHESCPVCG